MAVLPVKSFSLPATIESGQIFRYHSNSNGYYFIVVGDLIAKIRQTGSKIEYDCSNDEFDVAKFLGLNRTYGKILKSIRRDEKISAAMNRHYGLRILEQPLWECTASFICSSFSNIPRIRQCIERVASAFGEPVEFKGIKTSSFPQPQQISSFRKLEKCGLGYRAKYLFETAKIFSGGDFSLRQLRKMGYGKAKEKLLELPGVGSKVADCVLLFSCGFYEAFPVDVWIKRAMLGSYSREIKSFAAGRKPGEKAIADFARSYFGEYAGYAQQFIYHDARVSRSSE